MGSLMVTLACPRSGPSALALCPGCENRGPHLPERMEAREGGMDPPHARGLDSCLGPAGLERVRALPSGVSGVPGQGSDSEGPRPGRGPLGAPEPASYPDL